MGGRFGFFPFIIFTYSVVHKVSAPRHTRVRGLMFCASAGPYQNLRCPLQCLDIEVHISPNLTRSGNTRPRSISVLNRTSYQRQCNHGLVLRDEGNLIVRGSPIRASTHRRRGVGAADGCSGIRDSVWVRGSVVLRGGCSVDTTSHSGGGVGWQHHCCLPTSLYLPHIYRPTDRHTEYSLARVRIIPS